MQNEAVAYGNNFPSHLKIVSLLAVSGRMKKINDCRGLEDHFQSWHPGCKGIGQEHQGRVTGIVVQAATIGDNFNERKNHCQTEKRPSSRRPADQGLSGP
jgi:hypothetical protein